MEVAEHRVLELVPEEVRLTTVPEMAEVSYAGLGA